MSGGSSPKTPRAPGQARLLYVLLRCGGRRLALDAREVVGFVAAGEAGGEEEGQVLALAPRLGLRSRPRASRRAERVRLADGRALEVDEVERILDPGASGVMELPALLRLERPVFTGVLWLEEVGLVPVLDLRALLDGAGAGGGP